MPSYDDSEDLVSGYQPKSFVKLTNVGDAFTGIYEEIVTEYSDKLKQDMTKLVFTGKGGVRAELNANEDLIQLAKRLESKKEYTIILSKLQPNPGFNRDGTPMSPTKMHTAKVPKYGPDEKRPTYTDADFPSAPVTEDAGF